MEKKKLENPTIKDHAINLASILGTAIIATLLFISAIYGSTW